MTLQTFNFEGTPMRDAVINGEPWFVAADVCACLGIANSRDAVSDMPDDEKRQIDLRNTVGNGDGIQAGNPFATAVNEPGLYRLIFKSRKPEAERFKRWVLHEVLPEIRRTGAYAARPVDETFGANGTVPVAAYIALLHDKIALLEGLAKPKPKRTARPPLSDAEKATILRLHREGFSGQEIVAKVQRSSASVSMVINAAAQQAAPAGASTEGGAA